MIEPEEARSASAAANRGVLRGLRGARVRALRGEGREGIWTLEIEWR